MSWQEEFKAAVTVVVLNKGTPARARKDDPDDWRDDWVYGTIHPDFWEITEHKKTCEFTVTGGKVDAVEWSAFDGTFNDNQEKHGLVAVASCACGKWQDITFLYEAELGEVMHDLLAAAVIGS